MATGEIEIQADELEILSRSTPLPFQLDEEGVDETIRIRYRWLDLRRARMQRNIRTRAKLVSIIRAEMDEDGFVDIETPIMGKPTPEGARDFLVPTRLQPGRFFALPQSPQIYKQLLVISGFERYYQIARCFRDEDLRADRLQELTQLDVETAFPDQDYLFGLIERIVVRIWKECRGVELERPFLRLTWEEADRRFGIRQARPALRARDRGRDRGHATLRVQGVRRRRGGAVPARAPRALARRPREARGGREAVGREGPRLPRLRRRRGRALADRRSSSARPSSSGSRSPPGTTVLFGADTPKMVSRVLGALRLHLGRELELIDTDAWRFLWVTDFPMFEWDPELERWDAVHHPFTRPTAESEPLLDTDPGRREGDRVRPGRERRRARRRVVPDPRAGAAGQGVRAARHQPGGAAREVRLPARRARDGRAAARRDRVGDRPALDDPARRAVHPRHASRSRRTRPASTRCPARRRPSRSPSSTSSGSP